MMQLGFPARDPDPLRRLRAGAHAPHGVRRRMGLALTVPLRMPILAIALCIWVKM